MKKKNAPMKLTRGDSVRDRLLYIKENKPETVLHGILKNLFFKKMYKNIEITHGNREFGKDIVFKENRHGSDFWTAVVVKNKDAVQGDIMSGGEISKQIDLSFDHPYQDCNGNKHKIHYVIVVVNGGISSNFREIIPSRLKEKSIYVDFWNEDRLEEEIEEHIKEFFLKSTIDSIELGGKSKYLELWTNILDTKYKYVGSNFKNIDKVSTVALDKIIKQQLDHRFCKETSMQQNILYRLYGNDLDSDQGRLIVAALKDSKLFPELYDFNELEKVIQSCKKSKSSLYLIRERYQTLTDPSVSGVELFKNDAANYELMLRKAFNFDFIELKQLLEKWKPKGYWKQSKAMLLALFDRDAAKKILSSLLSNEKDEQEKYNVIHLLNIVDWAYPFKYSMEQNNIKGLDGVWDVLEEIINKLLYQKPVIKPYGTDVRSVIHENRNSRKIASIRYLQFLVEMGIPLSYCRFQIVDPQKWYLVAKELYETFPLPVMYYSLFCNNKDILKRIGQDFAYSDTLRESLPSILNKLLLLCLSDNRPRNIDAENILGFAQSLLIAVSPEKWERGFIEVWSKIFVPNVDGIYSNSIIWRFIESGLALVADIGCRNIIISDCLEIISKKSESSIDCLYHLSLPQPEEITDKNVKSIDDFIESVNKGEDFQLLGNLYKLLSKKQIEAIGDKIYELPESAFYSTNSVPVISFFAEKCEEPKIIRKVKTMILSHPKLWDNGFLKGGSATLPDFLNISKISKSISWEDDDCLILYEKLKNSLYEFSISNYKKEKPNFSLLNYEGMLKEMYYFLKDNKESLTKSLDYDETVDFASIELDAYREYTNLEDALYSLDNEVFDSGIMQLIKNVEIDKLGANKKYVDILIKRTIMQISTGLDGCLYLISEYISKYPDEFNLTENSGNLLLILKKYQANECQRLNLDVPTAFEYLIKIAELLEREKIISPDIAYWLKIKKDKRFNFR